MKNWAKSAFLGAVLATMTTPVMAQETIKATVIDGYPARALWVKEFTGVVIVARTAPRKADFAQFFIVFPLMERRFAQ